MAIRAAPGPGDSIPEREAGVKRAAKDSDEAKRIVVVHMKHLIKLIGLKQHNTEISFFSFFFFKKFPKLPYRTFVKLYLYLIFQTPRNISYMWERSAYTDRKSVV